MTSLLVFGCSFTLLLLGMDRHAINVFDEGEVLVGAQHVFWGGIPYRDFWTAYGPAQYWIIGNLFKLFGPYVLVERLWDITVRAALATLAHTMSRHLTNSWISVATWLSSLGWLWVVGFYGYPLVPAAFLGLLSAYLLMQYAFGIVRTWSLLAAGVFVGLAALFRYDIGVYTLIAEIASLLLLPLIIRAKRPLRLLRPDGSVASSIGLLVAGTLLATAPAAAYLILNVPYEDLLHPLIIYPLTIYVPTRSLPFPSIIEPFIGLRNGESAGGSLAALGNTLAVYFSWIIVGIAVMSFWRTHPIARRTSEDLAKRFAAWLLTLLVLSYSLKSTVRPQAAHTVHAVAPSFVLAGVILLNCGTRRFWLRRTTIVTLAIMAYPPVYAIYRDLSDAWTVPSLTTDSGNEVGGLKRLYWNLLVSGNGPEPAKFFHIDPNQAAALSYIRTHTAPGDRLFVANERHDLVFANDVLFYFLADRRPASKYYEFDPGVTTTAEVQAAIIDGIRKAQVKYVVRSSRFNGIRESNKSSVSSGVVDLDRFLERDFESVARFGDYEIRERRD